MLVASPHHMPWRDAAAARRGGMLVLMVFALFVFLAVAALSIDVGLQYTRKASFQVLADMAAVQSLAITDTALSYDEEDASIRHFVANICEANGHSRSFFKVKTYPCNEDGVACGTATSDHGHRSTHSSDRIDCSIEIDLPDDHSHDESGDSHHSDTHSSHEHGSLPAGSPSADPRVGPSFVVGSLTASGPSRALLGSLGVTDIPAWQRPGAINLADSGHGGASSGHTGHGMRTRVAPPTPADVCRVELVASLQQGSFFSTILGIRAFTIGVYAAAQRNIGSPSTVTRPPCGFYGAVRTTISGSAFADSFDSGLGTTYLAQRIHTDDTGAAYARQAAVGCSDGPMTMAGNSNVHGGLSAIGQVSIDGNSFRVHGDVKTGGSANPTGFPSNVKPTSYPAGSGDIVKNVALPAVSTPAVDFTEACALPRMPGRAYCPKATATLNDNSGQITGWYDSSALSGSGKVLKNGTGSGSATSCDGSGDKKRICLDAGYTYYFKKIDLSSSATLVIKGTSSYKTLIYLDSANDCGARHSLAGQVEFGSSKPADVFLLMGSSTLALPEDCDDDWPQLKLTGGGTLSASIYGPGYDLDFAGSSQVYGKIVGRTVSLGGSTQFHFDEALTGAGSSSSSGSSVQRILLVE